MAILSDSRILREMTRGNIIIEPFYRECLGSNSYDIHLGRFIGMYRPDEILDPKKENFMSIFEIPEDGFTFEPGRFYLASTLEYTATEKFVPYLDGKSSIGRLSISIHESAGNGDVGFKGHWTLQMGVDQKCRVYYGMPIGQIRYETTKGRILNPYHKKQNSKYSNHDSKPIQSMMWKNFGKDPIWR